MFRRVTAVAGQRLVLAFERVTGLLVVECFDVPLDEGKIHAVVLGMAACAILAGCGIEVI